MRELEINDPLLPKNARKLAELAKEHGWFVRCTHVEFDKCSKDGSEYSTHQSIAIRMHRDMTSAWAVWIDDGFDAAAISRPLSAMGYRELKDHLTFSN